MRHFDWMVIDRVDRRGLWFIGSKTGVRYVFWWNPLKNILNWLRGGAVFGFFPLLVKHIKLK